MTMSQSLKSSITSQTSTACTDSSLLLHHHQHQEGSHNTDSTLSLMDYSSSEQKQMDEDLLRRASKPLVFRNVFCGREHEILQMEGIFRRTAAGRATQSHYPSLVLVSGASGTGKSALVCKLRDHLGTTEEEFFWISGKFEEQQTSSLPEGDEEEEASALAPGSGAFTKESTHSHASVTSTTEGPDNLHPFAAIVDAFEHFCEELEEEEPDTVDEIKEDIRQAVGQQGDLLTYMIPSLTKIIGSSNGGGAGGSGEDIVRFHYVFRNFLQALATKVRSVVLVLEDLHRADKASLELLHYLFTSKLKHVMFVGTYRSNEVDDEHRFSKWLHGVQEAQQQEMEQQQQQTASNTKKNTDTNTNTNVTTLGLAEMSLETINTFISNVLNLTEDETRALAHIVFTKTNGNIFFVTQYLVFLTRNYLLWFDVIKKSWDWDEPAIRKESAVTTTLLDFMKDKLNQSEGASKILPVAACLGAKFNRETLRMILTGLAQVEALQSVVAAPASDEELMLSLKQCEKERYIDNCGNKNYSFVHDKVQEAALILQPSLVMQQIRYQAGTVLLRQSSENELNEKLFVVVNLLNAGRLRYDSVSPLEIAKLNLRAAEKAKRLAAFSSASSYVETALACLPHQSSSQDTGHSALVLELWSLGAEVNGAMGRTELMEEYCNKVLDERNEYTVFERLRAQNVMLDSCCNIRGQPALALERCMGMLQQLDCNLPKGAIGQSVRTISSLMQSKAPKNIPKLEMVDSMEVMTDRAKLESMRLMDRASIYAYLEANPMLFTVCIARMVRWTIKYGICDQSPFAFAMLGVTLMHVMGDYKVGAIYAELALSIMRKLQTLASNDESQRAALTRSQSRTSFAAYGFVLYWIKSVQDYQDEMVVGYEAGMRVGDTESALWNTFHHIGLILAAGKPLETVEEVCRRGVAEMVALKRGEAEVFTRVAWQGCLNLMGAVQEPTILTGSAMQEQDYFDKKGSWKTKLMPHVFGYMKILLCAFLGDYEQGAKLAVERGDSFVTDAPGSHWTQTDPFHRGICLYAAAIKTKKRVYKKHAQKVRGTVKAWASKGNANAVHQLKLLDAEHEACFGKRENAKALYEAACTTASSQGFIQDAALANERFAEFLLSSQADAAEGQNRVLKAVDLYREWGARAKVQLLVDKYPELELASKPLAPRNKLPARSFRISTASSKQQVS